MKNFLQKFSFHFFSRLFFVALLFSASVFYTKNSYANTDYGVGRIRYCPTLASNTGEVEGLDFDPTSGGKDVEFVLSNPVCLTVIATSYAAVKIAIAVMNSQCSSGSPVPRVVPSPIMDAMDIARATRKIPSIGASCGGAVAAAVAAMGTAIAELGVIYGIAKPVFDNARICGQNWMKPNPAKFNISTPDYKQTVKLAVDGYIRVNSPNLSLDDQMYRQFYYGGVEVQDNPNQGDTCYDVTAAQDSSGNYPVQTYYMKGTESGNFNCKKYQVSMGQVHPRTKQPLTQAQIDEFAKAYACCRERSQEYVCIDYDPGGSTSGLTRKQVFCKAGTLCTIQGITFSAKLIDSGRLVCAETYSLCPYNFSLGGGSEYCDYYRDGTWSDDQGRWIMITEADIDAGNCGTKSEIRNPDCTYNDKAGNCRNYCQYLTHCSKTSGTDFQYVSGLSSPYFSVACMNFIGDSQNQTSFGTGFILGSQKHFSAPIAQCVKETLENVFYNRAGHSQCVNTNEFPNADGSCPSGQYVTDGDFIYKMGNQVQDKSFFSMVQDNLQDAVKLVLTLSIMFYGLKLLFGMSAVTKKELLVYILKMGVVLYFATGDAWQTMFFKGVYGASSEFANIVFKIEVDPVEIRRDGCQFGNITTPDGVTASSGRTYPAGKEYLAIWDTLDCKIMRYLGFGPEDSAANIASLIAAGFFTGPVGIYFAISVMFFGFFFIAATIRALHIFLSSALSIIIFVFISPIVIPTMLFAKTNNIFKAWATNLMSFALQPMILFAYIAIFIMVLDKSLIGSAIFVGQGPSKTISCAEVCKNADGTTVPYVGDQAPACDQQGQYTVNPLDDSVACLIAVNQFGKFPGLELFGLSIPILDNLFKANVKQRILAILKGALVMYLLCKFMDEIPTITSKLIGGTALPTASTQASGMLKSLGGTLASIQKRTTGLGKKIGRGAADYAKGKVRDAGDRGKALAGDKGSAGDKTSGPKGDIVKGQAKGDADKTSGPKGGDSSSGPKKT